MAFFGNLTNFDHKTGEWQIFHSKLKQFFVVNKIVDEEDKRALLFTHMTDETYRLLRNLAHPKELEELEFKELVKLLDGHFKKKQCTYADKAKFYAATRVPSESLGDWAARLRGLATYCNFGAALEANLADRFILGLGSGPERDKLFEKTATLSMAEALEIAEKAAVAREAKTEMAATVKEEPVFYGASGNGHGRGGWNKGHRGGSSGGGTRPAGGDQRQRDDLRCAVCGMRNHDEDSCRYKRYRCQKCGVIGHLKKVCKSKNSRVNCIATELEENVNEGGHREQCCRECQNFNLRS
ncbi:uncharacterized protein LOC133532993 [Cydia pomonella]|uniref:uncharacterized protein LOC133519757 n=1 Tax=Cydia pomonella TaxID=82600 RepID=UPI002ADDF56F|nr:uncharacterized protein LOC133519757 [Cydia pomonella]XP_061727881.1 uncharacterized protein LOC133532993 [Cydia pomonella]